MDMEEDADDPMEIDDTVQTGQIIERKSDEFTPEPTTTVANVTDAPGTATTSTANPEDDKEKDDSDSNKPKELESSSVSKSIVTNIEKTGKPPIKSVANLNMTSSDLVNLDNLNQNNKAPEPESTGTDSSSTGTGITPSNTEKEKLGNRNPPGKTPVMPEADQSKKSKGSVIVVLDDSDDEVIDLVETSKNKQCINYACKSGTNMMAAPGFCLAYFRVKCSKTKKKEVCEVCYNIAVRDYDKLVTELYSGNLLFDVHVPLRSDMVEIDDSDEETQDDEEDIVYIDEKDGQQIMDDIDDVIEDVVARLRVETRIEKELTFLKDKKVRVAKSIGEIEAKSKTLRDTLDRIQIDLYNEFRPTIRETPELHLTDDYYNYSIVSPTPINASSPQQRRPNERLVRQVVNSYVPSLGNRTPGTVTGTQRQQPAPTQAGVNPNATARTGTATTTTINTTPPAETVEVPQDLPKIGIVEKPALRIGDTYFIIRDTWNGPWIRARLLQVIQPDPSSNQQSYKMIELKQLKERVVTGKQVAYVTPSSIRLTIGTRVIAALKESTPVGETKKPRSTPFYPGVVAEPPVAANKYRYLIFFDIGYSQYVHYNMVMLVLEASPKVWEDMNSDCQDFIKNYLESSDRPTIKTSKDQTIRTEYKGKWHLCTVMDVDCSLVQVFFESLSRTEWIYRGSSRLSAIYREQQAAFNRVPGVRPTSRKPGLNEAPVQYTRSSDFAAPMAPPETPPVRAVARKSTTRLTVPQPPAVRSELPFLPPVTCPPTGPTSKIMYFTPRDQIVTRRPYYSHECSPKCKDFVTHDLQKLISHNPLSKPLVCGWARMTVKVRGRKEIIYKAPCGRLCRHMGDIHHYFRVTQSNMTVDLFDFNQMVRCLAEFSVECAPDPKDLSKGLEQVPIPVINGISNEKLDFTNYSIKRIPTEGVVMNLDPEFLCGCDCEDDCVDKTKCACWKLTMEGAKHMNKDVDPQNVGYIYRRLYDQVLTGIYECNSRCKCTSTCLNRVAQNRLSLKLQVFRTLNRGWGIRAINDVPRGTFICCYAGTIHTEHTANKEGKEHGDEYFADLDYIESVEKTKEDYESDVPEDSDEEGSRRKSPGLSDDEDDEEEDEVSHHQMRPPNNSRNRRYTYNEDNDFIPSEMDYEMETQPSTRRSLRRRAVQETNKKREEIEAKAAAEKKEAERTEASSNSVSSSNVKQEKAAIDSLTSEIDTVTISDDEDEDREILSFNPKAGLEVKKTKQISMRELFGPDECVYVMDAKNEGNIGRFLNHSCSPNVFVQNVFVDTHDPRFPWVAFFSSQFIRAGTELVWNYNYDIGCVNGRVLYCHCASLECKGRLL